MEGFAVWTVGDIVGDRDGASVGGKTKVGASVGGGSGKFPSDADVSLSNIPVRNNATATVAAAATKTKQMTMHRLEQKEFWATVERVASYDLSSILAVGNSHRTCSSSGKGVRA
jgi:hypothetical protein